MFGLNEVFTEHLYIQIKKTQYFLADPKAENLKYSKITSSQPRC